MLGGVDTGVKRYLDSIAFSYSTYDLGQVSSTPLSPSVLTEVFIFYLLGMLDNIVHLSGFSLLPALRISCVRGIRNLIAYLT